MNKHNLCVYIPGHSGLVGQAFVRKLRDEGSGSLLLKTHLELDLTNQGMVTDFFSSEKPDLVILAAAKVGLYTQIIPIPQSSSMRI